MLQPLLIHSGRFSRNRQSFVSRHQKFFRIGVLWSFVERVDYRLPLLSLRQPTCLGVEFVRPVPELFLFPSLALEARFSGFAHDFALDVGGGARTEPELVIRIIAEPLCFTPIQLSVRPD